MDKIDFLMQLFTKEELKAAVNFLGLENEITDFKKWLYKYYKEKEEYRIMMAKIQKLTLQQAIILVDIAREIAKSNNLLHIWIK